MRTVVALWCIGCGVTGCTSANDDGPGEPPWQSGPRMRAKKLVAADGFEVITGWYDAELALDCLDKRTTPYEVCGAVDVRAHYYTDATCTEPAIALDAPARFAWGRELIHEELIAYEVGAPWTGPTYAMFDDCVPIQPYPQMFRATVATNLAIAHYEPDSAIASRHVWSDGAYQLVPAQWLSSQTRLRGSIDALVDQMRDETCAPIDVAGQTRCMPPSSAVGLVLYADASCAVPVDRTTSESPVLVGDHVVYPTTDMSLDQYWAKLPTVPGGGGICQPYPWERGTYAGRRVELTAFVELFPAVD